MNILQSLIKLFFVLGIIGMVTVSCSSETRLLNKIPINSVEVQVLDQTGNPISGAQVEASNGRQSSTDADGKANIRFGSVGVYTVTVLADNRMPNNFIVTMPTDRGETITARLTDSIKFTGISLGSVNMYPLLFNYMFSSYGYGLELSNYEEGQWTSWKIVADDDEESMHISKAFLKELDNNQQWWRMTLKTTDEDQNDYTAEVLFSEDRSSIVRYREKIGDSQVQEKPVSEGWYTAPTKLTKESREGAVTKENIEISTEKGTYNTDLLTFGVAPETNLKIWQATDKTIPGAVIKYQTSNIKDDEEFIYKSEIIDFGDNATTKLGSY